MAQVKTYNNVPSTPIPGVPTPTAPPPPPVVVPPTNTALQTKLISAFNPKQYVLLKPASDHVLQCAIKVSPTLYFSTQADLGSNGNDSPYQSTVLSRMDGTGKLLDYASLVDGGHGTSFAVETVGSDHYIWISYQRPLTDGGTNSELVRFRYTAGNFMRNELANIQTIPELDPGYCVYAFDWEADWMVVRYSRGRLDGYVRRKISEFRAGINKTYGRIELQQGPPTLQGFCTINNAFFRWIGAQNGNKSVPADPMILEQYNWTTGKRVDRVTYTKLGQGTNGQWRDNVYEPESCTMYRDPVTHKATLLPGVTTGKPGNHAWPLFSLPDIGDAPA